MAPMSADFDVDAAVANLPSDFSSDSEFGSAPAIPRAVAPASTHSFRQTTLFGTTASNAASSATPVISSRQFRADLPPEAPTHHALNREELKTWVYPMNIGSARDYQYSIVKNGLFNNTLVALPTGLGKTFIAATIMLNFYRWTKDAQIVFMAPTKPLVAQQVDACFNICGIPRSATTMLTGEISPALRSEEWATKRVFFMTPQTLDNDLRRGIADPKKIVLLVVDEAHRATGNYSYVKVVELIRRFNKSFRILALTATPGGSVEAVQDVIDGLEISQIEIRTENSIDIQPYVHSRTTEQIILEPDDNLITIQSLISKTLQSIVNQLAGHVAGNAFFNRDPLSITSFGMIQSQQQWASSGAGRSANQAVKGMVRALFAILGGFGHSIKLLNIHGMGPFYQAMETYRSEGEAKRSKCGKYQKQILESPHFKEMMDKLKQWSADDSFISHPKITCLCDTILNHFMDNGDGLEGQSRSSTRIIVFCEYRASAEDIATTLNKHGPMIRASVFVGQAASKHSEGMKQKDQIETIEKFKNGTYNVIVATSIGEEGLDIGQVDLIICYDGSSSPIRMLQRMGRTGRKRAGRVVLLLMKGKEEASFAKANDNYEKMQRMISDGKRFKFHSDLSSRIMPKDVTPVVDKRVVEIPIENTQDPSLPEPRRRPKAKTKMRKKRFNMPDDVETGFQPLSKLWGAQTEKASTPKKMVNSELQSNQLVVKPPLARVLLDELDERILKDRYQTVAGDQDYDIIGGMPEMTKWPEYQRSLAPTSKVKHGAATKRMVKMLKAIRYVDQHTINGWEFMSQTATSLIPPPYAEDETPMQRDETSESEASTMDIDDFTEITPRAALRKRATNSSSTRRPTAKTTKPRGKPAANSKRTNRGTSIDLDLSSEGREDSRDEDDEVDSELDDFVVPDDAPIPSLLPSSIVRKRSLAASITASKARLKEMAQPEPKRKEPELAPSKAPRFFEPTHFHGTQDTEGDDEMPDIGVLLGKRKAEGLAKENRSAKKVEVVDLGDTDEEDGDLEKEEEEEEVVVKRRRVRPVLSDNGED